MKIIGGVFMTGFIYLVLFQLLGEFIVRLLDLHISGAVMGMLVLLFFYSVKKAIFARDLPESLRRTSHWLIPYLPLLLLPVSVGVVDQLSILKQHGLALLFCLVGATILSLVVSGLTFKFFLTRCAQ